jgi:hypothetical protein
MQARPGDILEALFLRNFIVASTPVVSRRVLDDVGVFDESPDIAPVEDWELWLRIAAKYEVACVEEPLVRVRLHDDSFLASTPLSRRVTSQENVIYRSARGEPTRLQTLVRSALFNAYFAAGVASFRNSRTRDARRFFWKAWSERRSSLVPLAYIMMANLPPRFSTMLVRAKRWITQAT